MPFIALGPWSHVLDQTSRWQSAVPYAASAFIASMPCSAHYIGQPWRWQLPRSVDSSPKRGPTWL